MFKKVISYIIAFIAILFVGYIAGSLNSKTDGSELERQITEYRTQLEEQTRINKVIGTGLADASKRIGNLQIELDRITKHSRQLVEKFGDFSGELELDIREISEIRRSMDRFIEEN